MICKHCGKDMTDSTVCPHCGKDPGQPKMVSLSQMTAKQARKKPPQNKKERILRIALIVAAAVLAVLVAATTILWAFLEGSLQRGSDLSGNLGINDLLPTKDVQNIALFGLDDRDSSADGHSDAIIIVSIDRKHNKIKMTHIGRDTLVPVEGYKSVDGKTKITHAFSKGGVNLAVKTLNRNFGMNITDYAYVNFMEFVEIIDYIGGVTINVLQKELYELNNHIYWMGIECGLKIDKVKKAGEQRLTGGQALAYARVRKVDSDIQRGNRQKDVLQAMFNEVKELPLTKFPGLVSKLLKMCHTNMSSAEVMSIATWTLTNSPEFVSYSLPNDDCKAWGGNHANHGWVWVYDLEYATNLLHNFIYEDGLPTDMSRTTIYIPKRTTTTVTTAQVTQGGITTATTADTGDTTTATDTDGTATTVDGYTGTDSTGTGTATEATQDVDATTATTDGTESADTSTTADVPPDDDTTTTTAASPENEE